MIFKLIENIYDIKSEIPTEYDIKNNKASFMGIPIHYVPNAHFEGRNMTDYIELSDKFFNCSKENQLYILYHEVAHNISDKMVYSDWDNISKDGLFITHKIAPKGSIKGDSNFPDYWEGLFGDVGSNSLFETVTDAIVYYFTNKECLKRKNIDAYNYIDNYFKTNGYEI